jgi:hypothetical protein
VVPPTDKQLAKIVTLDDVAVFQAIKVDIAKNGKAVALADRNAPIVAGRDVVVRAYVSPTTGTTFAPRPLWARLTVEKGAASQTFEEKRTLDGPSVENDPKSVFQFDVPASLVGPTTTYRVSVLDPEAPNLANGVNSPARFPRNGLPQALQAQALAGSLAIRFVPIRYKTGGANTMPDLGANRLTQIRAYLRAIYPVDTVSLSVGDELVWTLPSVDQGNFDFGELLPKLTQRKQADKAAAGVYYIGVVVPAATYAGYCGGSCKNGLASVIPTAGDDYGHLRVGGVVGYWDEGSLPVLAHELGHLHGLAHSQCSTDEASYTFPYKDGGTHVWGYDERTKKMLDPSGRTDLMGNCPGRWMSSYSSKAIFARLTQMAK